MNGDDRCTMKTYLTPQNSRLKYGENGTFYHNKNTN